jgi:hypothetical protein
MAEKKGKLVSCDRCGEEVFLKCTGESATDGGYTRWNKFEDLPHGWDWHSDTGRLCPACNKMYIEMLEHFMKVVSKIG